jgi:phosphate transport system permease protein
LGVPAKASSARGRGVDPLVTSRGRLLADRIAKWVVTTGGLAIIGSILAILVFILLEVWPLTSKATVLPTAEVPAPAGRIEAIIADEHRTSVVCLTSDGVARAIRASDGVVLAEKPVLAGEPAAAFRGATAPGGRALVGASDGRVLLLPVGWEVSFDEQVRRVMPEIGEALAFDLDPSARPLGSFAGQLDDGGKKATVAAQLEAGTLVVARRETTENSMTGEITPTETMHSVTVGGRLSALVVDHDQASLYAGTPNGEVLWWRLRDGAPEQGGSASAGGSAVTALSLLIGDRALVVGQADGSLSIWFRVRQPDGTERLTRIRDFPGHAGGIARIAPSLRGKAFLAQDATGLLGLHHSTSHRTLWRGRSSVADATALVYTPKADGAFVAGSGRLAGLDIACPHPEVSLRALFGKVWYESYPKPEYVWQSTGGTEDFEPKLSLTPLLFGTFKGTLYSLILAIPLGVLSAMYASQFMHPNLRRFVKPTVEIMAALPSVVLGFLAGLWLAPRVEKIVPALVLMVFVLPILVLAAGFLWRRRPRGRGRRRSPLGTEALVFVLVLAGGAWLCLALNRSFAALLFGGDFPSWLLSVTGLQYDQRNAIVVGLAMGFAVIPIIFAIAEDAFSNVPRNLTSGSLALGATRWQTVTRVVLPSASPGIFAAVMVGFGRAVGETMIVLMATGNTPIMEWNPFNGFRTLSANVAVEITEAPHRGTLYRTLFLAALLLFVVTFIVNTVAEVVRQRLRRRYSEL